MRTTLAVGKYMIGAPPLTFYLATTYVTSAAGLRKNGLTLTRRERPSYRLFLSVPSFRPEGSEMGPKSLWSAEELICLRHFYITPKIEEPVPFRSYLMRVGRGERDENKTPDTFAFSSLN